VQLQETQLPERLTVAETVRLFQSFYPTGRKTQQVLDLLDLEPKRGAQVGTLSGGQKQRLALACALVSDPEILFLDEPTTGLDPQARLRIWSVVEEFRSRGGTVLLTTHAMDEAERLCDRVAIMDLGHRIALGTPEELIRGLEAEQVVELELAGNVPDDLLASLPGVARVARRDGQPLLSVSRIGDLLPALLALLGSRDVPVEALVTRQPSLEDVFIHLTGRGLRDA
jgi:ABC-2 type transport system ATP-binding protein